MDLLSQMEAIQDGALDESRLTVRESESVEGQFRLQMASVEESLRRLEASLADDLAEMEAESETLKLTIYLHELDEELTHHSKIMTDLQFDCASYSRTLANQSTQLALTRHQLLQQQNRVLRSRLEQGVKSSSGVHLYSQDVDSMLAVQFAEL